MMAEESENESSFRKDSLINGLKLKLKQMQRELQLRGAERGEQIDSMEEQVT